MFTQAFEKCTDRRSEPSSFLPRSRDGAGGESTAAWRQSRSAEWNDTTGSGMCTPSRQTSLTPESLKLSGLSESYLREHRAATEMFFQVPGHDGPPRTETHVADGNRRGSVPRVSAVTGRSA